MGFLLFLSPYKAQSTEPLFVAFEPSSLGFAARRFGFDLGQPQRAAKQCLAYIVSPARTYSAACASYSCHAIYLYPKTKGITVALFKIHPAEKYFTLGKYLLLGLVVISSACSTVKWTYNYVPSIAYSYINSKVDLDQEQSELLKTNLKQFLAWHRSNELPQLIKNMESVQLLMREDHNNASPLKKASPATHWDSNLGTIDQARVNEIYNAVAQSLERSANYMAPLIAESVLSLRPAQLAQIQNSLNESNKKYRQEHLQKDMKIRAKAARERMENRFDDWFNHLNKAQLARIQQWADKYAANAQLNYENRLKQQTSFMALFEQAANKQISKVELTQKLAAGLNTWQKSPENTQYKTNRQEIIELITDLANQSNSEQRMHAANHAQKWIDDFLILINKT